MGSSMGRAIGCALAIAGLIAPGSRARAQVVQIAALSDVSFGTISSVATNRTASQTLCVYSSLQGYTIKATGSGSGGAFSLANISSGGTQLAYSVQWAFSGSQTTGTQLTAGQGLHGTPTVLNILCGLNLLSSNASLIVTLPAANLSLVRSGNFSGTLSLMVSPN